MNIGAKAIFAALFPNGPRGRKDQENNTPEAAIRLQKGNNVILGRRIPPKHMCQCSEKIRTQFGLKLHLVGFAVAKLAQCKMGVGRCSPRRRIRKYAGPLPRACQIMSKAFKQVCPNCAMETYPNSFLALKTQSRAAIRRSSARTVVSCLRGVRTRGGPSGGVFLFGGSLF